MHMNGDNEGLALDLSDLQGYFLPASVAEVEGDIGAAIALFEKTYQLATDGDATGTDGRVTALVLNGNRLSGLIPPELGNLTSLTRLALHNNQLSGCVPGSLQNTTAIQKSMAELGLPFCQ